jgi:GntR family transcriptional regulator
MMDTPVDKAAPAVTTPKNSTSAAWSQLRIDDSISEPYYLQLHRQIQALLHSGALVPGCHLPSERDLADMLKISRLTVKRCYDELRRAHVLVSKGRGGTRVQRVPHIEPVLRELKGFTEEMRELDRVPTTRVLDRAVVSDRIIASVFNRFSGGKFLRLVRLRLADDIPMSRETAWYDMTLAPGLENWPGDSSAYQFLREHCGLPLTWATQSIEAVTSSREETEAFNFTAPGPCLLLKRHSYTAANELVEYAEGTFRGDAYRYQIKLGL